MCLYRTQEHLQPQLSVSALCMHSDTELSALSSAQLVWTRLGKCNAVNHRQLFSRQKADVPAEKVLTQNTLQQCQHVMHSPRRTVYKGLAAQREDLYNRQGS